MYRFLSIALLQIVFARGTFAQAASAEKGNEVFDEQCASCHYAYRSERKVGPGLKLLFAKGKLESDGKPVTDANVRERIDRGGKGMPAYRDTLSADDKADLIAYLKTL